MPCDRFECTLDGVCTKIFCVYKSTVDNKLKVCEHLKVFSREDTEEVMGSDHVG